MTNDTARSERFAAANDLVQRTLAQHGLAAPATGREQPTTVLPSISSMGDKLAGKLADKLAGIKSAFNNSPPHHNADIPDGAEFRQERFSCQAGSRAYRTYVPSSAKGGVSGIVVMLHGCTQNPEDFALGTGMNELAEKHRVVVLYPQQSRGDNAQSCWNWFSRGDQKREQGEPAILSGMTRKAMVEFGISRENTFVAGLSAGAAMALILGETYPDVFSAVGAHSGLPFGAAKDVPSAFAAMAGNAPDMGNSVPDNNEPGASAVRTIVFHGSADGTVHPSNGENIARLAMDRGAKSTLETEEQGSTSGRSFNRKIVATADGVAELEYWRVDGLGHAWSGGKAGGSFTDSKGPDASAEMIRFFFDS